MKCNTCNGTGTILSCYMRRGLVCHDKSCGDCNGTGKAILEQYQ